MKKFEFNLVYCTWEKIDEEIKGFFSSFYGGDLKKGKEMYENYFLKYNLIHEVTHTLQVVYGVQGDQYESEQGANDVAVAYWREMDPGFLDEINNIVDHILSMLKNPAPKGAGEREFFVNNYDELGTNPAAYGYYQFKMVKNSLENERSLQVALIESIANEVEKSYNTNIVVKRFELGDVEGIVQGFSEYLKVYGVKTPKIHLCNQFTPAVQFVMRKID